MELIQDVIDRIKNNLQEINMDNTVDGLIIGDPRWEVKGIATTFAATMGVIEKAAEMGINLIITHEPTFYNNSDETGWLTENATFITKRDLIMQKEIAIWRFHDLMHFQKPDAVYAGMVKELGWNGYIDREFYAAYKTPAVFNLPCVKLSELILCLKDKLKIRGIRIVGNPDMECSRVGLNVGMGLGNDQIKFINDFNLDVLICGETMEWQTCEYVRDAVACNFKKAIALLGHANSEEAAMKYSADWLKSFIFDIPVTFIEAGDPFIYL